MYTLCDIVLRRKRKRFTSIYELAHMHNHHHHTIHQAIIRCGHSVARRFLGVEGVDVDREDESGNTLRIRGLNTSNINNDAHRSRPLPRLRLRLYLHT